MNRSRLRRLFTVSTPLVHGTLPLRSQQREVCNVEPVPALVDALTTVDDRQVPLSNDQG